MLLISMSGNELIPHNLSRLDWICIGMAIQSYFVTEEYSKEVECCIEESGRIMVFNFSDGCILDFGILFNNNPLSVESPELDLNPFKNGNSSVS